MQQLTQFCSLLTSKNLATLSFSGGLQMADKISIPKCRCLGNMEFRKTTRQLQIEIRYNNLVISKANLNEMVASQFIHSCHIINSTHFIT